MKKKQITYGVSGMMEYQAVVKVGRKNVSINFSDGSMTAMGINPATYTTDNIIMQNAIEASNDYKRGRIQIVRSIDLEEELHVIRNTQKPALTPIPATPKTPTEESEPEAPAKEQEEEVNAATPEDCEAPSSLIHVEFSCNDDAKDYLEQNFGYVRSKLRTREDIVNAGKSKNVLITFI